MTVLSPVAVAVESVLARAGSIQTDEWSIAGLEVSVDFAADPLAGELRIGRVDLVAAELSLPDTRVRCGRITITDSEFGCEEARLSADLPGIGRREFPGSIHYDRRSGTLLVDLRRISLGDGEMRVHGTVSEESMDISWSGSGLPVAELASMASRFGAAIPDLAASGTVDLSGRIRTAGGELAQLAVRADLREASAANEAGTVVAESLRGQLTMEAGRAAEGFEFAIDGTADAGEAYVEPVYANLAENKVTLSAAGQANAAFDRFDLQRYSLSLGTEVAASGNLQVSLPAGESDAAAISGSIQLVDASFETLYSSLLQVFLAGTLFGDLETAGTVSGRIMFADNAISAADLEFENLIADDRQARLAVYGLDGAVHWPGPGREAGDAEPSYLAWQGARAYDIPLDRARVDVLLGGDDLELIAPLRIPTMGGALTINRLSLRNFGQENASGLLDAELEPIQLGLLTGAFGWPAFSGTLAGKLPLLQYDGEVVTVGGTLSARAFDGDIEFANLRMEQPFGRVPRLYGDLRLRQLDLEKVTDTFSFGLIQGRLSGDVTGLQMIDWQPAAMDLHVYTPPGDKSKRRISQRAVENLASVGGGGAAAALSSGFMSFFDVFSYRKIGLRCILADGVCRMSGAGPAGESAFGQGYYIVQGSGLPRIDVVGYRHEVSWPRLVRQLVQITESGSPTIN